MTTLFVAPLLFIFGAIIGSFLNVVILRTIAGKNLGGRSKCPHCQRQLRWWELVPIFSFIILQGRCHSCRQPISVQYPLVELAMGLLTLVLSFPLPQTFVEWLALLLKLAIAALLVILFVVDLRTMLLPDRLVALLGVAVVAKLVVESYYLLSTIYVIHSLYGLAVGAGLLGLLWLVTRGRGIGLGDVKLMIPLGALFGTIDTAILLFVSFMAGGLVASYLLIMRRAGMKTAIPFGPFLTGTALLMLVVPPVAEFVRQFVFGGYL